jgi:hypothetical protein
MGNKTGEENKQSKPKKVLVIGNYSMKDLFFKNMFKSSYSDQINKRRALTTQIYQLILQITEMVLNHFKNEKNYKVTEKLLKNLETSKNLKIQIQKIWTQEFFQNFQKEEEFKGFHSFITEETMKRISDPNYIASHEDIKFCFECPFFKTNSYNDAYVFHFIYTGEHLESVKKETEFGIFLVSFSNDEEMKPILNSFQNRNLNENLQDIPIIVVLKFNDQFQSLLLEKKIPSFIGNLFTLIVWIVSEECRKMEQKWIEKISGTNIFGTRFESKRYIEDIHYYLKKKKRSETDSNLNVLILGPGEVGLTIILLKNIGKSTLFTQALLHYSDYVPEISTIFSIICDNVIANLSSILIKFYKYTNFGKEEKEIVTFLYENNSFAENIHRPYNQRILDLAKLLDRLMKEVKFQEIIQNHHKNNLSDSILYIFPNFNEIVQRGINLTHRDVLRLNHLFSLILKVCTEGLLVIFLLLLSIMELRSL